MLLKSVLSVANNLMIATIEELKTALISTFRIKQFNHQYYPFKHDRELKQNGFTGQLDYSRDAIFPRRDKTMYVSLDMHLT